MIANQLNPSMKNVMLGFSKKWTLYQAGCLVHCVARMLGKTRLEVHNRLKKFGCFFSDSTGDKCLLNLDLVSKAYPEVRYLGKQTFVQEKALQYIKDFGGLIMEVDGNLIMNGTQQHFVYFVGGRKLEDPLGGKIKETSTYKVISMRPFSVEKTMTSDPILKFIKENNITEGQLREGFAYVKEKTVPNLKKKIGDLESLQKDLTVRLGKLETKVEENVENEEKWQKDLSTAKQKLAKKQKDLDIIDNERKQWKSRYETALKKTADKMTTRVLLKQLFVNWGLWTKPKSK